MKMMTTPHRRLARRAAAVAAAAAACATIWSVSSAGAGTITAGVVFPVPGGMQINGLPHAVRPGHTFTMREEMPLAVHGGRVQLQRELASGAWVKLMSGSGLRMFWLHWRVPRRLAGAQLTVRMVLLSGNEVLAASSGYPLSVAAGSH